MKNSTFFTLAVVASMTLVSCGNSTNAMIDKYEAALKNGDETKAIQIANELDERSDELSEKQLERFMEITFEYIGNALDEWEK